MSKSSSLTTGGLMLIAASAAASTDYGPAIYRPPSCSKWYTSGSGHHFCVIHDMEGYYWTTISYLNRCDLNASGGYNVATSIHYEVNGLQNGSDEDGHHESNSGDPAAGEISQQVRESYYAWHARCWNTWMWGTEHEGFVSSPAWYSEAMYVASSGLQRHLMDQTVHPIDRNHVVGHNEWKNAAWKTWMGANYSAVDTTCNTHSDPGVYWNWSHFMDLITGSPPSPSNLKLTPVSTTQIKLTWTDNSTNETGFKIERALSSTGTWSQIATTTANTAIYTNSSLSASTVYYYRVRSYNGSGNSDYTPIKSATTGNSAPVLSAIGGKTVTEGSTLTFTATTTDTGGTTTTTITDFESFASGTAEVMFRKPLYSTTTDQFIDTTVTNYTMVTSSFPTGHSGSMVLKTSWRFLGTNAYPWYRLTTASGVSIPNPVIDFKQILKFDIYSDKQIKVAVGCRETNQPAGTIVGANGGTGAGAIEWAGATNVTSGQPQPTRTVSANTWTTLRFILPQEPIRNFNLGDNVLSTPSNLGVLEHLALVPTTTNAQTVAVYLDNFSVIYSNILTYSLDAGAPAGASINPVTGVFTWTPTEAQGPGAYDITVRVIDNGNPALDDSETITVIVNETNNATPTLSTIANKTVLAGDLVTFTNTANDADLPVELTFSLDPGAPAGADVNPATGIFAWTPSLDSPDSTNSITVRVTDGGTPEKSATRTFEVRVISRLASWSQPDASGNTTISWNTMSGHKYRIQFKSDLNSPDWIDASDDIAGNGATASQIISVNGSAQRFYRVVEVP